MASGDDEMSTMTYREISVNEVPSGLRWDVLPQDQGQGVEVAWGAFGRSEAGAGARYKRVTDTGYPVGSPERVTYYRRYLADERDRILSALAEAGERGTLLGDPGDYRITRNVSHPHLPDETITLRIAWPDPGEAPHVSIGRYYHARSIAEGVDEYRGRVRIARERSAAAAQRVAREAS